jgi:GntR family transcriptional regulator
MRRKIARLLPTKAGFTPSSRLLLQKVVPAGTEPAGILKIQTGERILHLRRLRLANEEPLALEDSHILLSRFPGLAEIDFSDRSLYETLRHRYGTRFGWADETIEAVPATAEEAKLLTISRRSSLLCISRTLMAADNTPLEYAVSRYRGDRYRASLRVSMSQTDQGSQSDSMAQPLDFKPSNSSRIAMKRCDLLHSCNRNSITLFPA